jgi:hypothetical protein
MGGIPAGPSRGRWEEDTLRFEQTSPMGRSRYSYRFEGPDRYHFRIESSRDGQTWQTLMEGDYCRKA